MTEFLSAHWLDIFTTILGFIYIWLEYKAHIGLWLVSIIMPAMDVWLYGSHGLYGDAGMAVYYTFAAIYGYAVWKFGNGGKHGKTSLPHHTYTQQIPTSGICRVSCSLGSDLFGLVELHRQHRTGDRCFHQCAQHSWLVGSRAQVCGAVDNMDCCRFVLLLFVYCQGNTL